MKFEFLGKRIKNKRVRLFGKMFVIPAKVQLILLSVCVLAVLIAGFIMNRKNITEEMTSNNQPTYVVPSTIGAISASPTQISTPAPTTNTKIYIQVHISGAVCSPGVVCVEENSRLADVIEAAGGLKDNCDLSFINLASFVSDGSKIYIPFKGETPYYLPSEQTPSRTDTSNISGGQSLIKEKININTATVAQLTQLNGIGESTAKKIIAYREANGDFKKIEDILQVSGIGETKFKSIKEFICV